jgi:hypothetical protein
VNGGSTKPELKVHIKDAMLAVAQARDELVTNLIYERKANDDHSIPWDVLSTLEVTLENGEAVLPKRGLSILKYNEGIYRVYTADKNPKDAEEVIPTPIGFNTLYKGLDGIILGGRPRYQPIGGKIQVQGVEDGCKLKIDMIVAGEEFDEDEMFAIPADLQNKTVNLAVQTLIVMLNAQHDIVTDAKPNA